jgi:hypothetical protein
MLIYVKDQLGMIFCNRDGSSRQYTLGILVKFVGDHLINMPYDTVYVISQVRIGVDRYCMLLSRSPDAFRPNILGHHQRLKEERHCPLKYILRPTTPVDKAYAPVWGGSTVKYLGALDLCALPCS